MLCPMKIKSPTLFFFPDIFNLWCSLLMIHLYHQTKTSISFLCRWGLNIRSLIQPLKILPVELTETLPYCACVCVCVCVCIYIYISYHIIYYIIKSEFKAVIMLSGFTIKVWFRNYGYAK